MPRKRRAWPPLGATRRGQGEGCRRHGVRCEGHFDTPTTCVATRRRSETNPSDADEPESLPIRQPRRLVLATQLASVRRSTVRLLSLGSERWRVQRRSTRGFRSSRISGFLTRTRRHRTVVSCGWTGAHKTFSWCVDALSVRTADGTVLASSERRTRLHPYISDATPRQLDLRLLGHLHLRRGRFHAYGRHAHHVAVVFRPPRATPIETYVAHVRPRILPPCSHALLDRRKARGKRPPGVRRWGKAPST